MTTIEYDGVRVVKKYVRGENLPDLSKPYRNRKNDFKPGNPGKQPKDPDLRFNKLTRSVGSKGCIQWKGKLNARLRGAFFDGENRVDPRAYAWKQVYGEYPDFALEAYCGTNGCVNVNHLHKKSHTSRRKQSAFTRDQVLEIRDRYQNGESIIHIAKDFPDASERSVGMAAQYKSYQWV